MNIAAWLVDPPKKFRPIPFWSWNERLKVEETRRQIAEMDRVGIGGYFMHARGGLQTPYLGEEWMENVAAGIDEARRRGMGAWIYDENGWPSGFGDGRVNGLGIEYQQKYLRWDENPTVEDERTITAVETPDGRRLRFYYDVNPFYVDTLDAKVVQTFLETILDAYAARFPQDIGAAMPGVFTDEPQVSRNGVPWSFVLPAAYQEAYGEDLLPLLPGLFFPWGEYRRTRYRFWRLVQELFVTSYTQQMYDWCERHGARLTGHMVLEETLLSQVTSNGAVMPHYEFFHLPGMDWLGRHVDPPTTPLQAASVAHQLGRDGVLSETFALCGWDVTWDELKWMFEWQAVRGVTQLCQHLEGYSLRGLRKRDYPPSLFFQQPWWDKYRAFNDYVSRLGMLLSQGEVRFEVLLLHPQSSAWVVFDNDRNEGIHELYESFLKLTRTLEAAHIPFHYGDERILSRHGAVEPPAEFAPARLRVGTQRYPTVVVPPCLTLSRQTCNLLREFTAGGGNLIWMNDPPRLAEGEPDADLEQLIRKGTRVDDAAGLLAALPETAFRISVADPAGAELDCLAATWRRFADFDGRGVADFYFFANVDALGDRSAVIRVPGRSAERVDLETGAVEPLAFRARGNDVAIEFTFPRRGSLAVLVYPDDRAATATPARPRFTAEPMVLDDHWDVELLDPNSLTLDACDFWIDGELVAEREHVSVVQNRCLERRRPVDLKLRFTVQVAEDFVPEGDLFLVLEQPEEYRLTVNGEPCPVVDRGNYRDTSFRKVDLGGRLRPGTNELVLETRFEQRPEVYEQLDRARAFEAEKNKLTFDKEVEAVYLVGNFGVATPGRWTPLPRKAWRYEGPFILTEPPRAAPPADLTRHGFPFFNGALRLTRRIEVPDSAPYRRFSFEESCAHVVALSVNGEEVKEWYWRPFETDLGDRLHAGENTLALDVTTGLRNLLGPHHLEEGESYAVSPASFHKEPNVFGCAAGWNDDYCFVQFGVKGVRLR